MLQTTESIRELIVINNLQSYSFLLFIQIKILSNTIYQINTVESVKQYKVITLTKSIVE